VSKIGAGETTYWREIIEGESKNVEAKSPGSRFDAIDYAKANLGKAKRL
jgi:hypothetical protein